MDKENMNSMKKKALAFAAAACAFGMLLSGCGSSNGDSTADKGSNVITAYNSEPQNPLIPGDCNETGGGKPLDLLFARLISFDAKGNASNEVAESIKSNDDATQYTIKLKDGWKFTDGTPVTAESFTKAWSYTANAKNAQLGSSFFSTIKGYDKLQDGDKLKGDEQLEGLKVVNDHEFTVDLNRSDSVFAIKVGYTAFAPLPESFFKDLEPNAISRPTLEIVPPTPEVKLSNALSNGTPAHTAMTNEPASRDRNGCTLHAAMRRTMTAMPMIAAAMRFMNPP